MIGTDNIGSVLVPDIPYGSFSYYYEAPAKVDVNGNLLVANTNVVLYEVNADFSTYGGQAYLNVFTGLVANPQSLDMLAFLPDGSIIPQMPVQAGTARAQLVHASPDPDAATVDVYLDYALLADDFAYQSATPFVDIEDGDHTVAIAPPTSRSAGDAIATFDLLVSENERYHIVAAGVLDPSQFPPNPDGLDTAFGLRVVEGAREAVQQPQSGVYEARLFNAVPDAPSVDFVGAIQGFPPEKIFSDIAYGSVSDYGGAVTNPSATGTFLADLGTGTDELLLEVEINSASLSQTVNFVVFMGILDANRRAGGENDPDGLTNIGFLPNGEKIVGERITALGNEPTEAPGSFRLIGNYPNPFNPSTTIRYELAEPARITLTVHDALGREVARLIDGPMPPGSHAATWNTDNDMPSGVYFVTLSGGEKTQTRAAVLLR
jgi:hypothetical protein